MSSQLVSPAEEVEQLVTVLDGCARIGEMVADCIVSRCPELNRERLADVAFAEVFMACQDSMVSAQVEAAQVAERSR